MGKSRRRRGDGTIHVEKRSGAMYVVVSPRLLTDGRRTRRIKEIVPEGTEKAANKKIDEIKATLISGVEKAKKLTGDKTLEDVFWWWLDDIKLRRDNISIKTYGGYKQLARLYILPVFGERMVDRITPEDIDEWLSDLAVTIQPKYSRPLSDQSIHSVFTILNQLLNTVKKKYRIPNPCDMVERPSVNRRQQRRNRVWWTAEQLAVFLDHIKDHPQQLLFRVAIEGMFRKGEVLAFSWEDFDPREGTLTIRKHLMETQESSHLTEEKQALGRKWGLLFEFGAKTDAGERTIPLPAETVAELVQQKKLSLVKRKKWEAGHPGETWNPADLIFPSDRGTPLAPSNITRLFTNLVEECGLPKIHFHDLRGSSATIMSAAGVPMREIQGMLGHETPHVTLEHYVKETNHGKRAAVDVLSKALKR